MSSANVLSMLGNKTVAEQQKAERKKATAVSAELEPSEKKKSHKHHKPSTDTAELSDYDAAGKNKMKEKHSKSKKEKKHKDKKRDTTSSSSPALHTASAHSELPASAPDDVEDHKANKARVETLCAQRPNNVCADCRQNRTDWAAVNHGVFVCIRCSGVHRSLGTHVSKVKSTNMDNWSNAEVELMRVLGNARVADILEADRVAADSSRPAPGASGPEVTRFVQLKYVEKAFAAKTWADEYKRAYKKVGYGPYAGRTSTKRDGDKKHHGHSADGYDDGEAEAARRAAALNREAALRAFYGDEHGVAAANSSSVTAPAGAAANRGSSSSHNGDLNFGTASSSPSSWKRKKGSRPQAVHGTFGAVNVAPEEYDTRLAVLMDMFLPRKVAPTDTNHNDGVEGDASPASTTAGAATDSAPETHVAGTTAPVSAEDTNESILANTEDAPTIPATTTAEKTAEPAETDVDAHPHSDEGCQAETTPIVEGTDQEASAVDPPHVGDATAEMHTEQKEDGASEFNIQDEAP